MTNQTHLQFLFGIGLMFASVVFFVIGHALVKNLSGAFPTHQIMFFRFLLTPLLLTPFFITHKIQFTNHKPFLLLSRAIIGCIAMFLYFLSLKHGDMGKMMLLFNLSVVWAFIFSIIFLKEKLSLPKLIAIPAALIGISMILKPEQIAHIGNPEFYAISASFGAAIVYLLIKKLRQDHNTSTIIYTFFALSSLILLIPTYNQFVQPTNMQWALLFLIGFLGFLAHYCMTIAYKYVSITIGTSINLTSIPLAYMAGIFFFSEKLDFISISGMIIFLFALLIITKSS